MKYVLRLFCLALWPATASVTWASPFAYVSNIDSNTVSAIDTATNAVTSTVTVGNSPYGVALTPDGSKAYVTNQLDNTVSVIDTATNTVTATVGVGAGPYGVIATPDGSKVYAC